MNETGAPTPASDGIDLVPEPPLRLPRCRVCGQNPVDPSPSTLMGNGGRGVCGCCRGEY